MYKYNLVLFAAEYYKTSESVCMVLYAFLKWFWYRIIYCYIDFKLSQDLGGLNY